MSSDAVFAARQELIRAVLHAIATNDYGRPGDPNGDAAADHADGLLALAARDLAEAVEKLPHGEQPIAWNRTNLFAADGTPGIVDLQLGEWIAHCEQHGQLGREADTDAGEDRIFALWAGHDVVHHGARVTDSDCCNGSGIADYAAVPCPNPKCPVLRANGGVR